MTELIRMSAEQMRRNAEQRYKEKDINIISIINICLIY